MHQIDITPKWYTNTADDVVREARRAVLCDVTTYWHGEKSKFGAGYKEHRAAGMQIEIGDHRVVATMPGDACMFPSFCAAMLDRLSAEKVQQLAGSSSRAAERVYCAAKAHERSA